MFGAIWRYRYQVGIVASDIGDFVRHAKGIVARHQELQNSAQHLVTDLAQLETSWRLDADPGECRDAFGKDGSEFLVSETFFLFGKDFVYSHHNCVLSALNSYNPL